VGAYALVNRRRNLQLTLCAIGTGTGVPERSPRGDHSWADVSGAQHFAGRRRLSTRAAYRLPLREHRRGPAVHTSLSSRSSTLGLLEEVDENSTPRKTLGGCCYRRIGVACNRGRVSLPEPSGCALAGGRGRSHVDSTHGGPGSNTTLGHEGPVLCSSRLFLHGRRDVLFGHFFILFS
jgi:hypothetical protein